VPETDLFSIFLERIEKTGIEYFIGGSVASIVYGEPRLTHDIDLVLHIDKLDVKKIIVNFPIDEFYLPHEEVMISEIELGDKGHFNIIHNSSGFKADIYFVGGDLLHKWALDNKRVIKFIDMELPIAPPEYIITKKLIFYNEGKSTKHIDDIRGILRESRQLINFETLTSFFVKYNLEEIYNHFF
jgi:hypothetical protein